MKEQTILSLWRERELLSQNRRILFDEGRALTAEELDALSDTIAAMLPRGVRRVAFLSALTGEIMPAVEKILGGKPSCNIISGYSPGGAVRRLFALQNG